MPISTWIIFDNPVALLNEYFSIYFGTVIAFKYPNNFMRHQKSANPKTVLKINNRSV